MNRIVLLIFINALFVFKQAEVQALPVKKEWKASWISSGSNSQHVVFEGEINWSYAPFRCSRILA